MPKPPTPYNPAHNLQGLTNQNGQIGVMGQHGGFQPLGQAAQGRVNASGLLFGGQTQGVNQPNTQFPLNPNAPNDVLPGQPPQGGGGLQFPSGPGPGGAPPLGAGTVSAVEAGAQMPMMDIRQRAQPLGGPQQGVGNNPTQTMGRGAGAPSMPDGAIPMGGAQWRGSGGIMDPRQRAQQIRGRLGTLMGGVLRKPAGKLPPPQLPFKPSPNAPPGTVYE
jgi:hypothetical protein